MIPIEAISLTKVILDWLADSHRPRVLHVFDHACNLINERREVLSVVTPQIGNGPFNLVIPDGLFFTEYLDAHSTVFIEKNKLCIDDVVIQIGYTNEWSPRPNWENLYAQRVEITKRASQIPIPHSQFSSRNPQTAVFSNALAASDVSSAKSIASKLSGLGSGLTPSGDDFILGALYASWIIHPPERMQTLANEIAETAAPSTTSLSAAWLRSAGRGEAGMLWHELFNILLLPHADLQPPISKLSSVGETSGADALAGFFRVISAFKERIIGKCPS